MKSNKLVFPTMVLIFFAVLSCGDNIFSKSTEEKIKKEITTTLHQYHKDIAEHGLLAEFAYLDSSDMFSWHPPGYNGPIGYDSVATLIKASAPYYTHIEHYWDTLTVLPATKTKGIFVGEITSILTDTSGRTDTTRYREEGMMMKRADGWKYVTGKTVMIQ